MKALLLAILLAAILAATLITVAVIHRSGVRRRDHQYTVARLADAQRALHQVEAATDQWRDIDSVLATEIRAILREHRQQSLALRRNP